METKNNILCDEHLGENRYTQDFLDYDEILALNYKGTSTGKIQINASRNIIMFILKGRKILANGEFMQNENEILFIKKGKLDAKNEAKQGIYQSYCIFFSNIFLLKFLSKHRFVFDLLQNGAKCEHYKISSDDYINEQIMALKVYFAHKNQLNSNIFKEIIKLKMETLFLLLLNREDMVFAGYIREIIEDCPLFATLLNNNGREFANVREMADFFEMNLSIFSRNFKLSFGISPKEWIDNEKFERAKLLLEFSNKNVTEICKELKINSMAWFIKRFGEKYGITPKQMQKANNLHFGK
ncbi:helix-turn-helix transcriptional regulator [Helicobacter sp. 23-1045]